MSTLGRKLTKELIPRFKVLSRDEVHELHGALWKDLPKNFTRALVEFDELGLRILRTTDEPTATEVTFAWVADELNSTFDDAWNKGYDCALDGP